MFPTSPLNRTTRRALVTLVLAAAIVTAVLAASALTSSAGEDDRRFGQLHAAYVAPDEVVFDEMELVEGDTDDGAYTVRNPSGTTVALAVAPDVAVTAVDCGRSGCVEGVKVEYAALTRRLAGGDGTSSYFWLTIDDGVVLRIDEQYLA